MKGSNLKELSGEHEKTKVWAKCARATENPKKLGNKSRPRQESRIRAKEPVRSERPTRKKSGSRKGFPDCNKDGGGMSNFLDDQKRVKRRGKNVQDLCDMAGPEGEEFSSVGEKRRTRTVEKRSGRENG